MKNIYQRILGVMEDVKYIQKGEKTVNGQYRFVSHDQVTSAIHDALVKHGIVALPTVSKYVQDGNRTMVDLNVKFVNAEKPDDFISTDFFGYGIDTSDKGPGKAVSYAFKYAILKTFCLETGDDPDQDASTEYKAPEKAPLSPDDILQRMTELFSHFDEEDHLLLTDYLEKLRIATSKTNEQLLAALPAIPALKKRFSAWKEKEKSTKAKS
jgi:hypothetical protein